MAAKRPRITFVVLADAHKVGERGKVDCFGIFSEVGVWGLPANRECSVVYGLTNVQPGPIHMSLWLKSGQEKATRVSYGKVEFEQSTHAATFANRIPLQITQLGPHMVGLTLDSHETPQRPVWIPFFVNQLPWPEQLSKSHLALALADAHTVKAATATLTCQKCETKYTFAVTLDPNATLPRGHLAFPESGSFKCRKCGTVHFLRDVEGQLRSQLGRSTGGEVT
jgi:hypothetical protein